MNPLYFEVLEDVVAVELLNVFKNIERNFNVYNYDIHKSDITTAIERLTGDAASVEYQETAIATYKTHIHNVLIKQGLTTIEENSDITEYSKLLNAFTELAINKDELYLDLTVLDDLTPIDMVVDIIAQIDPEISRDFLLENIVSVSDYLLIYLKENKEMIFFSEEIELKGKHRFKFLKKRLGMDVGDFFIKDIIRHFSLFGYDIKSVWGVLKPFIESCKDNETNAKQILLALGGSSLPDNQLIVVSTDLLENLDIPAQDKLKINSIVLKELHKLLNETGE